ncbi:CarD family transcriptional regulator [Deinococcus maricopensis]|uniref:Transcriptional regulator, CarD family n=1 Tax=Deinococcus maricopensis (strain DSM 21211 / LMG 22137 / NRRL B-23946 / LB-34) TaxID=709986 RepID=E8UBA7_DEIML|nr:CarD family transcriptional regulator [Deinococcus maricopensis]ADV68346.1 transcriptional regulator, CarD family [Deinococcus maricopensis DSM 21211]
MSEELQLREGDSVVYPNHGAGVVRALTERTVLGVKQAYYEVHLFGKDAQVLVPVARARDLGLRRATRREDVPNLLAELSTDIPLPESFQARYRAEQELLQAADLVTLTRLVGTLVRRDVTRGLPSSEMDVLMHARKTLEAELEVALGGGGRVALEAALSELMGAARQV